MRALVLAGGGSYGAYEVGVLKHLLGDLQIHYDIICGISVGALNGAFLAQFAKGEERKSIQELEKLWFKIKGDKDVRKNWLPFGPLTTWKPSLYNTDPLRKLIDENMDQEKILKSGKRLRVGAVSFNDGDYRVFNERSPVIKQATYGSAAYPIFFNPAQIGKHLNTDGGVRNQTPFADAIAMGATEIDVVIPSAAGLVTEDKLFTGLWKVLKPLRLALRTLEIMMDELALGDLKTCETVNKAIEGHPNPRYKNIVVRKVRPTERWDHFALKFDPENFKKLISVGYADARKMSWTNE